MVRLLSVCVCVFARGVVVCVWRMAVRERRLCWLLLCLPADRERIALGTEEGLFVVEVTRDGKNTPIPRLVISTHRAFSHMTFGTPIWFWNSNIFCLKKMSNIHFPHDVSQLAFLQWARKFHATCAELSQYMVLRSWILDPPPGQGPRFVSARVCLRFTNAL